MVTQVPRGNRGQFARKQRGGGEKTERGGGPGADSHGTDKRKRSESKEAPKPGIHRVPDANEGRQTRRVNRRDVSEVEERPREQVQTEEPDEGVRVTRRQRSGLAGVEEKEVKKVKDESSVAHVMGGGQEAVGRGKRGRPRQAESAAVAKDARPVKRPRLLEELEVWAPVVRREERQEEVVVEKGAQTDTPGEGRVSHSRRAKRESLEEKVSAVPEVRSKASIPQSPVTPKAGRGHTKPGFPRDQPMLGYVGFVVSVAYICVRAVVRD